MTDWAVAGVGLWFVFIGGYVLAFARSSIEGVLRRGGALGTPLAGLLLSAWFIAAYRALGLLSFCVGVFAIYLAVAK